MNPSKQFAYGKDTIQGCPCPAVAAGYSPNTGDESTEAAEWYDSTVRELGYDTPESRISPQQAKEAWVETVEQLQGRYPPEHPTRKVAEEIAKELGWL